MHVTRKSLFLIVSILILGGMFHSVGSAAILFQDDFEGDTKGKEPKKWKYDPKAEVNNIGKVDVDPLDPSNKVFTGYGGYLADKGKVYTDFCLEFDWLFTKNNQNNSLGFRVVDQKKAHYQLSRRGGGVDWKIYMFNGKWKEIVGKAWKTQPGVWYSTQLKVYGDKFEVKAKPKSDNTPFKDMKKALLKVTDGTHKKGYISTSYWGPIDNVIVADHEDDILTSVEPLNKLSTTWANLKTSR